MPSEAKTRGHVALRRLANRNLGGEQLPCTMETVKSLQMELQLKTRFGDYLATYLDAGFSARQLANTYNVAANTLDQLLTSR